MIIRGFIGVLTGVPYSVSSFDVIFERKSRPPRCINIILSQTTCNRYTQTIHKWYYLIVLTCGFAVIGTVTILVLVGFGTICFYFSEGLWRLWHYCGVHVSAVALFIIIIITIITIYSRTIQCNVQYTQIIHSGVMFNEN